MPKLPSLLSSLLLAAGAIFIYRFAASLSPGWVFYDSMMQWHWALSLWQGSWTSDLTPLGVTDHWPVFNVIFKWVFLKLGFAPSGVALLHFVSLYILFALGLRLLLPAKVFVFVAPLILVVFFYPVTRNFGIFHSSDVSVAVAFLGFVVAWLLNQTATDPRLAKGALILAGLCVAVSSQLRYNAGLSWGMFLVWLLIFVKDRRLRKALVAGYLVSLIGYVAIAQLIEVKPSPVVADGFALRNYILYSNTKDSALRESLAGIVSNPDLPPTRECFHGMYCHEYAQTNAVFPPPGSTGRVARAMFGFALRHPFQFLSGTWPFVASQLGLSRPLAAGEIGRRDYPSHFPATQMVYDAVRENEVKTFQHSIQGPRGVLARPWLWFAVTLALYAVFRRKMRREVFHLTWGLAFCYYFPFLWIGTLTDLRFFFPALMLLCFLLIYQLALIGSLIRVRKASDR